MVPDYRWEGIGPERRWQYGRYVPGRGMGIGKQEQIPHPCTKYFYRNRPYRE